MAPILYWMQESPACRAVIMLAKAIDFEFDLRTIDLMAQEHLKPEYIKINPQHTVPTLDDDGFILSDSHAISAYIVSKYAKSKALYPTDLKKRALIDQRLHFESEVLFPRMKYLVLPIVHNKETSVPQEKMDGVLEGFEFLEAFLRNQNWMAGNELSIADFSIIACLNTINIIIPVDPIKFPLLSAWIGRMKKLPYYDEVNSKAIENMRLLLSSCLPEGAGK